MSPIEKRAWLALGSMCPVYALYFGCLIWAPELFHGIGQRIGIFAAVAGFHAITYLACLMWFRRQERDEPLFSDERDRDIDARATRVAYFLMLTGLVVVGVVMPFRDSGWQLVNAALFFIVGSEATRYGLIVRGYRSASHHAH